MVPERVHVLAPQKPRDPHDPHKAWQTDEPEHRGEGRGLCAAAGEVGDGQHPGEIMAELYLHSKERAKRSGQRVALQCHTVRERERERERGLRTRKGSTVRSSARAIAESTWRMPAKQQKRAQQVSESEVAFCRVLCVREPSDGVCCVCVCTLSREEQVEHVV
jgi:hypothetical protein